MSTPRTASNYILATLSLAVAGCASLLPDAHQDTQTPWQNYTDAQAMYARIVPGKTTQAELKALGIDPERTANISILDHVDVLRRLVPTTTFDIGLLDPGLAECMKAPRACTGYEIMETHVDRQRVGSFWLDFFNFRRDVDITGWQFDTVIVLKGDRVIYKLWSGKPNIQQKDLEKNPLGPLQSIGSSLITR
jgi:hypothetical protein